MTSHFYQHPTETRTDRHPKSNTFYTAEKGFTQTELQDMEDLQ